jgi:hypothetical protein
MKKWIRTSSSFLMMITMMMMGLGIVCHDEDFLLKLEVFEEALECRHGF